MSQPIRLVAYFTSSYKNGLRMDKSYPPQHTNHNRLRRRVMMSKGKKKKNKSKEELNDMKDDKKYRQNRPPR